MKTEISPKQPLLHLHFIRLRLLQLLTLSFRTIVPFILFNARLIVLFSLKNYLITDLTTCTHIDQETLASTINRRRSLLKPPVPSELFDVDELLSRDVGLKFQKTKDEKDQFFRGVVGEAGHRSVVLGSQRIANWYSGLIKAGVDGQ